MLARTYRHRGQCSDVEVTRQLRAERRDLVDEESPGRNHQDRCERDEEVSLGHNQSGKWRRRRRVKQLEIRVAQLTGILQAFLQRGFFGRLKYALLKR